jgi:hypothetical protein
MEGFDNSSSLNPKPASSQQKLQISERVEVMSNFYFFAERFDFYLWVFHFFFVGLSNFLWETLI